MRIVFIGCVASSYEFLQCILKISYVDIAGVITRKSSKVNADFCSLSDIAEKHEIPCFFAEYHNEEDMVQWCRELKADIIYCFGWSSLLKESMLKSAKFGVVGYHPAELPRNRGRHPIIWALALGLKQTASTFFFMNAGADDGDIISQVNVLIDEKDDARTLYKKLMDVAVQQIGEFTQQMYENRCVSTKQNNHEANYWRKRSKKDGCIDWRMPAKGIYNLVRALSKPYPGAHFEYKNQEVKVWKAEVVDVNFIDNIEPGKVIAIKDGYMEIQCGMGILRIKETEPKFVITEGEYL